MAHIVQEKLFNVWWRNSLFNMIICHRYKDIDWREVLFNTMMNRGKIDRQTLEEMNFSETIFEEFNEDTKYRLEERAGIYQFDAGFSKLDSEIYAYIDIVFTPEEKEEIKNIKLKMRKCFGMGY